MLSLIGGAGTYCLAKVGRVYSRGNQKKKAQLLAFRRANATTPFSEGRVFCSLGLRYHKIPRFF